MSFKKIFFGFLCIVMLYSCAEDTPINPNVNVEIYSQLAVGNYWVYEKFATDSSGNDYSLNSFDSVYIETDTLINGEIYFKMVEPASHINISNPYTIPQKITYLRDSLDYIVTSDHKIVFSSQDFSNVLFLDYRFYPEFPATDTMSFITGKMTDENYIKNTPAGTFTTVNFQKIFVQQTPYDTIWNNDTLYFNTRYAANVGIVSKSLSIVWFQTTTVERRLIRYHLN